MPLTSEDMFGTNADGSACEDYCKWCYDKGEFIENCTMEEFIDKCAGLLGKRIRSCHIKDIHLKQEYTIQLEECAPGCGEYPLKYYVRKMNEIDPDMPIILEHLNTDEEYIRYMEYLKTQVVS